MVWKFEGGVYMTVGEVADRHDCSTQTVRNYIHWGWLTGVHKIPIGTSGKKTLFLIAARDARKVFRERRLVVGKGVSR